MSDIRLYNIEKYYEKKRILNIKKFVIKSGKLSLVIGENGVGKTTLLKIAAGLIKPDSGSIKIDNIEHSFNKRHLLVKKSIYVSDKPYLFDCSVYNNVAYHLFLNNKHKKQQESIIAAMKWIGIYHLRNKKVNKLSTGERQKVALARAKVINPKIWLFDEAMVNLDQKTKIIVKQWMDDLLIKGHGLVLATHQPALYKNNEHLIYYMGKTFKQ